MKSYVSAYGVQLSSPGEGGWYSRLSPEPIDVIIAWQLPYLDATVLKYLSRWRYKSGLEDLYKARWFLDKLIEQAENDSYDRPVAIPTT